MAAQLSLAAANVTDEDGNLVGAKDDPVLIRQNTMRIGIGNANVHHDVQTVTNPGHGVWLVRFADGHELTVRRGTGSCYSCSGRR